MYIFNGSASFNNVTAPSTIITGQASVGFGRQFIDVGDIDADGKDDYAISAPLLGQRHASTSSRVARRGTRRYNADSDADYILDLGPTYAATQLGRYRWSRLGDFNGDGVDDFAVGAFGYNGGRGRVVIVLGRAGFSAAQPQLQTIDGDPAYPSGAFGGARAGDGTLLRQHVGHDAGRFSANAAG